AVGPELEVGGALGAVLGHAEAAGEVAGARRIDVVKIEPPLSDEAPADSERLDGVVAHFVACPRQPLQLRHGGARYLLSGEWLRACHAHLLGRVVSDQREAHGVSVHHASEATDDAIMKFNYFTAFDPHPSPSSASMSGFCPS